MNTLKAVVQKVIKDGGHGPYVVATSDQVGGSVTFSLEPTVWLEDDEPEPGTIVALNKLIKKRAGWRARLARFWQPSDEENQQKERSNTGMKAGMNKILQGLLGPLVGTLDPFLTDLAKSFAALLPTGMREKSVRSLIGALSGYLAKIPIETQSPELALAVTKLRDFINFVNASLGQGLTPETIAKKWRERYFAEMAERVMNSDNPDEVIKNVEKQVTAIDSLVKAVFGKEGETENAKSSGTETALSKLDGALAGKLQELRKKSKWLK